MGPPVRCSRAEARLMARYEAKLVTERRFRIARLSGGPGGARTRGRRRDPDGHRHRGGPLRPAGGGPPARPVLHREPGLLPQRGAGAIRRRRGAASGARARAAAQRCRLAGARPSGAVRRLDGAHGVELRPDVPDMGAELSEATVSVLPMFSGSGQKIKVIEAFSSGLPVVANRLAHGRRGRRRGGNPLRGCRNR